LIQIDSKLEQLKESVGVKQLCQAEKVLTQPLGQVKTLEVMSNSKII
jgi:hypothetical protein